MYNDFKEDASIEWLLSAAVRKPDGNCVDEQGCTYELATVCGFNLTDTAGSVAFLSCMDEYKGDDPLSGAQACAKANSIDPTALTTCYKGDQGQELLAAAADVFNARFPDPVGIPSTLVNDVWVKYGYTTLKQALCSAGSTASVCKKTSYEAEASTCLV